MRFTTLKSYLLRDNGNKNNNNNKDTIPRARFRKAFLKEENHRNFSPLSLAVPVIDSVELQVV